MTSNLLLAAVGLVWAVGCFAQENAVRIPAGTELHIRLADAVRSSSAQPNQSVHATLIAPVATNGQVTLPSGLEVLGVIKSAHPATDGTQATLCLEFQTLATPGSSPLPIMARTTAVDNARETVDQQGCIQGIVAAQTLTAQADRGINKLAQSYSGLAGLLEVAKSALVKPADPEIDFEAGTEMTVALQKPLELESPVPDPNPPLVPFTSESGVLQMIAHQPLRAYAQNPQRPSDLTNLLLVGNLDDVKNAFRLAGWSTAAALDGRSKLETLRAVMEERGYKEGPVSLLTIENRPPDLVLQKTNDTFAARHHVRIWRRPGTYDGLPIWLVTATHDIGISFSEQEQTFIHQIDSHIDAERSKVANDLFNIAFVRSAQLVDRPQVPAGLTNATGDDLITDGRIEVLLLGRAPGSAR